MVQYNVLQDWSRRERRVNRRGYVEIHVPEHPRNHRGWVYEHRLVMERRYGRLLNKHETVHHISMVKTDNRDANLVVCTRFWHDLAHKGD